MANGPLFLFKNALSKVVGFLQVLQFPSTRKVNTGVS